MPDSSPPMVDSNYVSVPVPLPAAVEQRLRDLARQQGVELAPMISEWLIKELPAWVPDQAVKIRSSPSFREIRLRTALRELERTQSEYGSDVPGLRGCIKQVRAAINRAGTAPHR